MRLGESVWYENIVGIISARAQHNKILLTQCLSASLSFACHGRN